METALAKHLFPLHIGLILVFKHFEKLPATRLGIHNIHIHARPACGVVIEYEYLLFFPDIILMVEISGPVELLMYLNFRII